MSDAVKLFIVDDHAILREGLKMVLEDEEGMVVIGESNNGRDALDEIPQCLPDVVIMDISMPSLNGLEATRRLKKDLPEIKVIVLTMHDSEQFLIEALDAGACGYVAKRDAKLDLILAVKSVMKGRLFVSPSVSRAVSTEGKKGGENGVFVRNEGLTSREREVLQLLSEGRSSRDIGVMLNISLRTVDVHRSNIMKKLGVHNTTGLIVQAIKEGIIDVSID
jgi:DNA-binding NarL/FixJ family response regulator